MALWAFILSLTPVLSIVVGSILEAAVADGGEGDATTATAPLLVLGGLGSLLSLGGPIAAIALGLAARRDPTIDQRSRNLAFAAVLIGAITLGLYVVAILLFILFIAACAAACGGASCATAAAGAPCASLANRPVGPAGRRSGWRDAFAHHPDLPALRADVFRVAGARLCVGCFTAGPAFGAVLLASWLWPMPLLWAVALGAPLAAAQALSASGWTTTRARKVAVKVAFGAGAGLLLQALLAAPWPEAVRSLALAAAGLLALASTRPRLRRIGRLAAEADQATGAETNSAT